MPEEDAEGEEDPLKKNPGIGPKEVCLCAIGAMHCPLAAKFSINNT